MLLVKTPSCHTTTLWVFIWKWSPSADQERETLRSWVLIIALQSNPFDRLASQPIASSLKPDWLDCVASQNPLFKQVLKVSQKGQVGVISGGAANSIHPPTFLEMGGQTDRQTEKQIVCFQSMLNHAKNSSQAAEQRGNGMVCGKQKVKSSVSFKRTLQATQDSLFCTRNIHSLKLSIVFFSSLKWAKSQPESLPRQAQTYACLHKNKYQCI